MELGQDLQNLHDTLNQFLLILWPEMFAIVAFAFLLTAFLQVLKDIVPIRVMFQKYFLERWTRRRAQTAAESISKAVKAEIKIRQSGVPDINDELLREIVKTAAKKFGMDDDISNEAGGISEERSGFDTSKTILSEWNRSQDRYSADLRREIAELTTENNVRALCSLRADQLAGQLNTAAQHVTDYPQGRLRLLMLFAADAKLTDILATHFGALAAAKSASSGPRSPKKSGPVASESEPAWLAEFDDAKGRVQYHVQRAIDQLMISMGNIWSRLLRAISIILGLVVVLLFFAFGVQTDRLLPNTAGEVLVVVTIGIVSGYLASVFHDILMRLQGGRGRE